MNTPTSTYHAEPQDVRWIASLSATALHAADVFHRGLPQVESKLSSDEFAQAARALKVEVQSHGAFANRIWNYLCGMCSDVEYNRDLAALAIRKALGQSQEAYVNRLAGCLTDLENCVRQALPDLVNELALRGRPLRSQWEARGPGLMRQVAQWTDPLVIPQAAEVVLVHPVLGGGGRALLAVNRVHIEAVLTDTHPQLPEVLRLAWLIVQLNLDLPALGENVHVDRLALVAQLAMIPPVLKAAETVEFASFDPETLKQVLPAWHIPTPAGVDAVTTVLNWWDTFLETRPRWSVALMALDRMLG